MNNKKNTESTKQSHSCFLPLFKETFSCITIKKCSWTVIGRLWLRWSLTHTEDWDECIGGNLGTDYIHGPDVDHCNASFLFCCRFVSCLTHSCWAVCADMLRLVVQTLWSHMCRRCSRSLAVWSDSLSCSFYSEPASKPFQPSRTCSGFFLTALL